MFFSIYTTTGAPHLPTYSTTCPHQPAYRPRAIFQRPIVPRKRQEENNKGEKKAHERKFCGPWHVPRNAGKREKGQRLGARGPGNLGGPVRETLIEDTKTFTDGLRSRCRRFPSLISRWSCHKWLNLLSRTEQYRALKKETRTRRQQVIGGVRFTSSERIVHAGKFSRDVHQKIGQS